MAKIGLEGRGRGQKSIIGIGSRYFSTEGQFDMEGGGDKIDLRADCIARFTYHTTY